MGGIYSTQNKKFVDDNFFDVCDNSDPNYDENALVYKSSAFKGLHNLYVGYNNELVYVPKKITVGEFCSIGWNYPYFEIQESNLVTVAILLFVLSLLPNKMMNRWPLFIRLILISLGLVILARASNPEKKTSFSQLITSAPRSMSNVTKVSQLVNQGTFTPPAGVSATRVPGTRSTEKESDLSEEYLEMEPNTVLPLHTHAKPVFAVMISGDLEYAINGKWNTWSKGAILFVGSNVAHSVRSGPHGGSLMTFTDDSVSPLVSMRAA